MIDEGELRVLPGGQLPVQGGGPGDFLGLILGVLAILQFYLGGAVLLLVVNINVQAKVVLWALAHIKVTEKNSNTLNYITHLIFFRNQFK